MSVFSLWPVLFWKYAFALFEYIVFFKNVFSYFRKLYFKESTAKYVPKSVFHYKAMHKYANFHNYTTKFIQRKY